MFGDGKRNPYSILLTSCRFVSLGYQSRVRGVSSLRSLREVAVEAVNSKIITTRQQCTLALNEVAINRRACTSSQSCAKSFPVHDFQGQTSEKACSHAIGGRSVVHAAESS